MRRDVGDDTLERPWLCVPDDCVALLPVSNRFPSSLHTAGGIEQADVVTTGEQQLDGPGIAPDELASRLVVLLYHLIKISDSPCLGAVVARLGHRPDLPPPDMLGYSPF